MAYNPETERWEADSEEGYLTPEGSYQGNPPGQQSPLQSAIAPTSYFGAQTQPAQPKNSPTTWGGYAVPPEFWHWSIAEQTKFINGPNGPGAQAGGAYFDANGMSAGGTNPPAQPEVQAAPAATGSPVTATGQIAPAGPPAPPPPPAKPPVAPSVRGQEPNETRYVQNVDLSKAPAYAPAQFSQGIPGQALLDSILAHPETLGLAQIAQMKEQQKEQALLGQQQQQQLFDQSSANRGTLGSGYGEAFTRGNMQEAINAILSGNRAVDLQAAQTNRNDQLNALTAGLSFGNAGFQRQQAQADENYRGNQDALNRILSQFGINQGVAQNAQQNYAQDLSSFLGLDSAELERQRLEQQGRQFAETMGLNYDQLDQQGQLSALQYLMNYGGS